MRGGGPAPGELAFRLLGPVAAVDVAGQALALGPPRRRAVLAAMLVHASTTLSVDQLIDLLWDGPAPLRP